MEYYFALSTISTTEIEYSTLPRIISATGNENPSVPNTKSRHKYKTCFVQGCKSATVRTPDKRFFYVPKDEERRKKWFAVSRGYKTGQWNLSNMPSTLTRFYCCEDHFNEETDFKNFMQHRLTGAKLYLKHDAIPSVFSWREQRLRPIKSHSEIKEGKKQQTDKSLTQKQSGNSQKVQALTNSDEKSSFRFRINPQTLPPKFRNIIIEENDEKVVIRSNIQKMEDIKPWMNQFEDATYTKWNIRDTNPNPRRLMCKKRFICHQTGHLKVKRSENSKGNSKNAGCKARLIITVKLNTPYTRKTDEYVKDGLTGIISIDLLHNHPLDSDEVLRFLPASDSTREKFIEYFNSGMGAAKAKEYHESYLMLKKDFTEKDLTSGSLNPKIRTIREWYHKWKLERREPKTEKGIIKNFPKNSKTAKQAKADAAWAKKLLSAMTCEKFPADETNPQILAIEIKQEPVNHSYTLSSTSQNVPNNFAEGPSAKRTRKSLLHPPVMIKQEIISSDEEL